MLLLRVLWDDREKYLFWHLRWHIAAWVAVAYLVRWLVA